ncbi:YodC family protein [Sinorhizobium meliloti]|uniref:YodC family protein n=1 Tax=Rhizobium meliloti TaxID=382 RepID=UPI003D654922
MENEFKPGDVVQLKSGGPPMTVSDVPKGSATKYICVWFKGASKEQAGFEPHSLKTWVAPVKA